MRINKVIKLQGIKSTYKKSVVFLHINGELSKKIKEIIPFPIAIKIIKYSRINSTRGERLGH